MSDNVLVVVLPSFDVCGQKSKSVISTTSRRERSYSTHNSMHRT
jgi:hypothetical protein